MYNCPVSSWPFTTGAISVEILATTMLLRRGMSISQVEISATTMLPPSVHEAFSYLSLRYRLQLRCLHEVFPYLRLRYRLQLVASTRSFHSYHTFYGHHPGWCNCPVSSWPFATGGISVEISATTMLPP